MSELEKPKTENSNNKTKSVITLAKGIMLAHHRGAYTMQESSTLNQSLIELLGEESYNIILKSFNDELEKSKSDN